MSGEMDAWMRHICSARVCAWRCQVSARMCRATDARVCECVRMALGAIQSARPNVYVHARYIVSRSRNDTVGAPFAMNVQSCAIFFFANLLPARETHVYTRTHTHTSTHLFLPVHWVASAPKPHLGDVITHHRPAAVAPVGHFASGMGYAHWPLRESQVYGSGQAWVELHLTLV